MKRILLLLLCALTLLCACAPIRGNVQALAYEKQASAKPVSAPPSPVPKEPSPAEIEEELLDLWREELSIDVSKYLPENFFGAEEAWTIFGSTDEERVWLPEMAEAAAKEIEGAAKLAVRDYNDIHKETTADLQYDIEGPSWQLMLALAQGRDDAEAANGLIEQALDLEVNTQVGSDGRLRSVFSAKPMYYRDALRLPGEDEKELWSRRFLYSYLYTVFGADAKECEYELPEAQGALSDGIVWPLQSYTRLRKTWYAPRNGGIRKHTGTDIWAKADTEIYSCTDGTVSYVGEGNGTGFAVIVTDSSGYEYHYYHMIRLSEFLHIGDALKAGDIVGNVGNTGNSDLDHLHLTIVAPDGKYINPYPYLKAIAP